MVAFSKQVPARTLRNSYCTDRGRKVKTLAERKLLAIAIRPDQILGLLLKYGTIGLLPCDPKEWARQDIPETAPDAIDPAKLPADIRIVSVEAGGPGCPLKIILESDSLPESCEYPGYMTYRSATTPTVRG